MTRTGRSSSSRARSRELLERVERCERVTVCVDADIDPGFGRSYVVVAIGWLRRDEPGGTQDGPNAGRPTDFFVSPWAAIRMRGPRLAPWRTIRHAVSQLTAGDTLYLRGGVYSSPEDTIDSQTGTVPSGTPGRMR